MPVKTPRKVKTKQECLGLSQFFAAPGHPDVVGKNFRLTFSERELSRRGPARTQFGWNKTKQKRGT